VQQEIACCFAELFCRERTYCIYCKHASNAVQSQSYHALLVTTSQPAPRSPQPQAVDSATYLSPSALTTLGSFSKPKYSKHDRKLKERSDSALTLQSSLTESTASTAESLPSPARYIGPRERRALEALWDGPVQYGVTRHAAFEDHLLTLLQQPQHRRTQSALPYSCSSPLAQHVPRFWQEAAGGATGKSSVRPQTAKQVISLPSPTRVSQERPRSSMGLARPKAAKPQLQPQQQHSTPLSQQQQQQPDVLILDRNNSSSSMLSSASSRVLPPPLSLLPQQRTVNIWLACSVDSSSYITLDDSTYDSTAVQGPVLLGALDIGSHELLSQMRRRVKVLVSGSTLSGGGAFSFAYADGVPILRRQEVQHSTIKHTIKHINVLPWRFKVCTCTCELVVYSSACVT
jgi:hypothetical protein